MARHWIATRPGNLDVLELVEYRVRPPAQGEVTIKVLAAGMNPADYKHVANGAPSDYPKQLGYEVAGIITAIGPDTELASGGGSVGDEVLAYRIAGGWASEVTVAAKDVFAKPASIPFDQAAFFSIHQNNHRIALQHQVNSHPGESWNCPGVAFTF